MEISLYTYVSFRISFDILPEKKKKKWNTLRKTSIIKFVGFVLVLFWMG